MLFPYDPKRALLFSSMFNAIPAWLPRKPRVGHYGDLCVSFQMKPMPGAQAICQLGAGRARLDSRVFPSGWRCLATGPMTSECPRVPWGKQAHSEG